MAEATKMKFQLGRLVATPGAFEALEAAGESAATFIRRHVSGDWGELDPQDVRENEYALENGSRLLSSYRLNTGQKLWIITESDRSCTTLLLPNEY